MDSRDGLLRRVAPQPPLQPCTHPQAYLRKHRDESMAHQMHGFGVAALCKWPIPSAAEQDADVRGLACVCVLPSAGEVQSEVCGASPRAPTRPPPPLPFPPYPLDRRRSTCSPT